MPSDNLSPDGHLERTDSSSYIQFTPKRAMASFDNLVALANHQERLREAKKMVWRNRGEPAVEVADLWECLEHAGRGGMRAGNLAFAIRASVNIVLALVRIKSVPRKLRLSLIYHAIFGRDSFRFAAMLGSFVALYKLILNGLPIILPVRNPRDSDTSLLRSSNPKYDSSPFADDLEAGPPPTTLEVPLAERTARLSLSAEAHQIWVRKRTRRWHAVLAGAVAGGLSVMFEAKSRRVTIAQQLFVRGLQGSYNAFSTKHGIRIPYGDVMLFSVMSGQILYAWLLRPDTLPRSYTTWVGRAAHASLDGVRMNRDLVRTGKFDLKNLRNIIAHPKTSPENRQEIIERLARASAPTPSYGPNFAPCAAVHPPITQCRHVPLDRFLTVFKWMLPVYGALHLIPTVLFKWDRFWRDPLRMLMRVGWGTTRSSAFLGVFVTIYQTYQCYKSNLHETLTSSASPIKLPKALTDLLVSKQSFWLGGFLSGFALLVEEQRRRGELAMYVLPKGLESMWVAARGKGLVFKTGEFGEMILTAIGMGMVMSTYQNDPQHLSGLVRRILYQFIGPN
ncbi:hypothetical protein PLICRDRAFT_33358 [Plicaturopsis crispa FD-325 SS-3]|nr:hypothetical protein PLICRDRAFT_33358 [Plicaturopsis crispa FD-325 SS-3]